MFQKNKKGILHLGVLVLVIFSLLAVASVGIFAKSKKSERPLSNRVKCALNSKECPSPSPTSTISKTNKISWSTPYASLEADDFFIIVNGKKFTGAGQIIGLQSDPPHQGRMTLERQWMENGVRMMLFIYFSSDGKTWKVDQIRTADGTSEYYWVYYNWPIGSIIGGSLVQDTVALNSYKSEPHYATPSASTSSASPGIVGTIYFKNLKLSAFLTPAGCASENPRLSLASYASRPGETDIARITARTDCAGKKIILENHTGITREVGNCVLLASGNTVQSECKIEFTVPKRFGDIGDYFYQAGIDLDGNGTFDNWSRGVILSIISNSSSTPSPSTSPNLDSDGDGFTNGQEAYMGTNASLACGVNAWPPDVDNNKAVNIDDITALAQKIGTSEKRYDLNQDGAVDTKDLDVLRVYFGKTCR